MISCGEKYTLSIKDADKNIALEVGDSKTVVPEYSEGATLVWESSDQNVVTVSNGTINAVKEGSATITVSLKEKSELKVEITVKVTKKEVVIKEFTVKFVGKDGETLKEEKVEEGKSATAPEAPVVEGYIFKNWDKEFSSVTSDLEVKAVYEKVEQPEPEELTISDVLALEAGSEAQTKGTVVAVNAQSFLIKDATGMILVYEGSSWTPDVKVGDVVKVTGTTALYGGAMQFAAGTVYEFLETVEVNYEEAKELTTEEYDAYATMENVTPLLIKMTGVLAVSSGKYFNVTLEGAIVTGSISYPVDKEAVTALDGKTIIVTGYITNVTGSGKYLNVMALEVVEKPSNPDANKYTVTFVGKDGEVLKTEEVEEGRAATAPDAPVVEGFVFKGWDKEFTSVTSDLTVTAVYEEAPTLPEGKATVISFATADMRESLDTESQVWKNEGVVVKNLKGESTSDVKDYVAPVRFYANTLVVVEAKNILGVLITCNNASYAGKLNDAVIEGAKVIVVANEAYIVLSEKADSLTIKLTAQIRVDEIKVVCEESSEPEPQPTKYTVTFVGKDGEVLKTEEVEEGKAATAPEAPVVEGYTFKNWDKEFTNVTSDLTVTAVYEEVVVEEKVKITFNWNISSAEIGKEFYNDFNKYAGTVVPFETFLKDSHPAIKTALANAEMLSKWQWLFAYMKEDLLAYNANATDVYVTYVQDTAALLDLLIAGDTTAIGLGSAPGPNGRTLIRSYMHGVMHNMKGGGSLNANFAIVSPDFSEQATQEALVNAKYASSVEIGLNEKVSMPEVPTKPDYRFVGWYTDDALTQEFDFETTLSSDITLYAKWVISKFKVTFNGTENIVEVENGKPVDQPEDPVKEGYFFRGWYTDEDFTNEYDFTTLVYADLVLYPKFEEQQSEYTVTLVHGITSADIGMLFYQDFVKYAGTDVPFDTFHDNSHPAIKTALANAEMLSKWQWLFAYMKEDLKAYNAEVSDEFSAYVTDTVALLDLLIAGDTTAIGLGSAPGPNGRTLIRSYMHGVMHNMKGCGSSNENYASVSPDYSDELVQKALVEAFIKSEYKVTTFDKFVEPQGIEKFEYELKGWFTDGACTEAFDFETQITNNYTLYALWAPTFEMFEVKFEGIGLTVEVKENTKVSRPNVPEKVGFEFDGWFVDPEFTTPFNFNNPILADTVIYSKWISTVAYTVTFDLDGGMFEDGYKTSEEIGRAFYEDFVKYAGEDVPFETFHASSHPAIKTALANEEMLEKWQWLFAYMLEDLKAYNGNNGGSYTSDTYNLLQKLIDGDTTAIGLGSAPGPNGRTLIRSYMHGVMHNMKGCGSDNATFASYSPDFSLADVQKGLVLAQFGTSMRVSGGSSIPEPIKEGYKFDGWYTTDGTKVTEVLADVTVTAKWVETILVTDVTITNKVSQLELLKTLALEWIIGPEDAINKLVKFVSTNPEVATINDNGVITAVNKGTTTIKVISLSSSGKSDEFMLEVTVPAYFDISYETESYVQSGQEIKLNCEYIDGKNKGTIVWTSLNPEIAVVDENGKVTGVLEGVATIRASVEGKEGVYQDFYVTVVSQELSEAMKLVLQAHNSNVYTTYDIGIGAGVPNYYTDIIGSVSNILFEDFVVNTDYNQASNDKYGEELQNRLMSSVEFIVVHYTAGFNRTAGALAHIQYFAQPLSQNATSIHYTTGNDGIYKGLDEQYIAAHAGDSGSGSDFAWRDTNVEILDSDPEIPVVTITKNATFAINGRDTGIKVPEETKFGRGYVTDSKWLNPIGLGVNKKDGKYQLGTAWWCYSQVAEGRICSNGGNNNGIGIETAVNIGSDLWYTWQKTAMLVADIMIRNNLDITKVKGHNAFSGKDCPQPMLENDLEIWNEFIEMIKVEYERMSKYKDLSFEIECDNQMVNGVGRVTEQQLTSQVIKYKVTLFNNYTGELEEITLSSIVEGVYAK